MEILGIYQHKHVIKLPFDEFFELSDWEKSAEDRIYVIDGTSDTVYKGLYCAVNIGGRFHFLKPEQCKPWEDAFAEELAYWERKKARQARIMANRGESEVCVTERPAIESLAKQSAEKLAELMAEGRLKYENCLLKKVL